MINFKSVKLGCGIVLSLTLSGCYMDSPDYERQTSPERTTVTTTPGPRAKIVEKSAVKEPVQQTTPGPKRTAAPQIPVIQ